MKHVRGIKWSDAELSLLDAQIADGSVVWTETLYPGRTRRAVHTMAGTRRDLLCVESAKKRRGVGSGPITALAMTEKVLASCSNKLVAATGKAFLRIASEQNISPAKAMLRALYAPELVEQWERNAA